MREPPPLRIGNRRVTGLARYLLMGVIILVVVTLYMAISGWLREKTLEFQLGPLPDDNEELYEDMGDEIEIPLTGTNLYDL